MIKKLFARYHSFPTRSRRLVLIVVILLLTALASIIYRQFYSPLTPIQRVAYDYARRLYKINSSIDQLYANMDSYDASEKRVASFLKISGAMGDECYGALHIKLPEPASEVPAKLKNLSAETNKLCTDVVDLASYSDQIFDAVDSYIVAPTEVTWTLPRADRNKALLRTETLSQKARTSLANIDQVLAQERRIRYPGVPEIRVVLQQNIKSLERLESAIRANEGSEADELWKPTLTDVSKNQHDIFNQRGTFWREFVELYDLQQAVHDQNKQFCSMLPSRHRKEVCI